MRGSPCKRSQLLLSVPAAGRVYFGQLLGMCDHITFPLGASGYNALKVVPYGPIRVVLPYLIRRAQENGAVLGRAAKERKMITRAFLKRFFFPV
jgi:proline dehydrogenase